MNRYQRVALPIMILLMSCTLARSDTIYSFTGSTTINDPNIYEPGLGCSFTPCSLSGEFTFTNPLPANLAFGPLTPTYWDFIFPHRAGFDFSPNPGNNIFNLATDNTGQVVQWSIRLDDQYWNAGPDVLHFYGTPDSSFVHVYDWADDPCVGCDNFYLSGGWTITESTAAIPEPSALVLFSTGLLFVLRKAATAKRRERSTL